MIMTKAISFVILYIYDLIFRQSKDEIIKRFNKGKSSSRILHDNDARKKAAALLFKNNKRSDEYYTDPVSWTRYLTERGWLGKKFCDPFLGDGGLAQRLKNICKIVTMGKGDFFDLIQRKNTPKCRVLANPPFSSKFLVMQSLLEIKKPFSLILPFQVRFTSLAVLQAYQKIYGGRFNCFILKSYEQVFSLPDGKKKPIGVFILEWDF
jgi:hypothetical protein